MVRKYVNGYMRQLLSISDIVQSGRRRFYTLSNADGKTWMLPARHIRTALELYQPSGSKGRLLKRFLPLLHNFAPCRTQLKIIETDSELLPEILSKVSEVFDSSDLEYSIFGGTPSVHQKITIQFFEGKKILGYGKLSASEDVANLFVHEQSLLADLCRKGIESIPECLLCEQLSSGGYLFVQSTVKPVNAQSPADYSRVHDEFLCNMFEKTKTTIWFEESDFCQSLNSLTHYIESLPDAFKSRIESALESTIAEFKNKKCEMSAFHADFTPWNMFVHEGKLYVFDWEYGRLTYPPMLDRYHFIIQQAIHVKHLSADAIKFELKAQPWFSETDLRCYLIDVISRFVCRERGQISPSLNSMLAIWTELL